MLTVPIMQMMLPVFTQALWERQPPYVLPLNSTAYTGLYQYHDPEYGLTLLEIYIDQQNQVLLGASTDGVSAFGVFNLTSTQYPNIFRTKTVINQACRWLNDGSDSEFIYFDVTEGTPSSFIYMATMYEFVSKVCPQC